MLCTLVSIFQKLEEADFGLEEKLVTNVAIDGAGDATRVRTHKKGRLAHWKQEED